MGTAVEKIRFLRDPDLPGVEFRHALNTRQTFPNHTHRTYAVGLMDKGSCWCLKQGDDRFMVRAGEIALLNPELVHSGAPTGDFAVTYRMLYLEQSLMAELAGDVRDGDTGLPELNKAVVRDPALRSALERLHGMAGVPAGGLEKESLLVTAASALIARHADPMPPDRPSADERRAVTRVKEYLAENLPEKVTLDDLSEAAGLSRCHLLRTFKKSTGLPPHAWQTQLRVERAKTLLRKGMSPSMTAAETGFTDQSHFTRKFRQFTGITPHLYRTA